MTTAPTPGRIVHYRLSVADCDSILQDRARAGNLQRGNHPRPGEVVPLLVVRVWDDEYKHNVEYGNGVAFPGEPNTGQNHDPSQWEVPRSPYGINGQAMLDGNDSLWVTSAPEGDGNGFWRWPERV